MQQQEAFQPAPIPSDRGRIRPGQRLRGALEQVGGEQQIDVVGVAEGHLAVGRPAPHHPERSRSHPRREGGLDLTSASR